MKNLTQNLVIIHCLKISEFPEESKSTEKKPKMLKDANIFHIYQQSIKLYPAKHL
jgi:hypothetical protein